MKLTEPSYILAELDDVTSSWVRGLRAKFAPHSVKWPVDICLVGSSGVGTIKTNQELDEIIGKTSELLLSIKPEPFEFLGFGNFPNTGIHYLEPPRSEFDALHEKLKSCSIEYEQNRFSYNPHCTVCYSPEYSDSVKEELDSFEIPSEAVSIKYYAIYSLSKTGIASRLHVYG